jgi:methionyl-tRNA formyltransferase
MPFLQTENINAEVELLAQWREKKIDAIIVLAFAQFLKTEILALPIMGCFNIHTSLLPKFRGAAPIQYALLRNEKSTGVSIQKMVLKMDAGDLCSSKTLEIQPFDNTASLGAKLKFLAALCLEEFLILLKNNTATYTKQNDAEVSFAKTIDKKDGFIDFQTSAADHITNMLRAFHPWPGVYFYLEGKRIKIHALEIHQHHIKAGEVKNFQGQLLVGTTTETLEIKKLQLEGKPVTEASSFLRGYRGLLILTKDL